MRRMRNRILLSGVAALLSAAVVAGPAAASDLSSLTHPILPSCNVKCVPDYHGKDWDRDRDHDWDRDRGKGHGKDRDRDHGKGHGWDRDRDRDRDHGKGHKHGRRCLLDLGLIKICKVKVSID